LITFLEKSQNRQRITAARNPRTPANRAGSRAIIRNIREEQTGM